MAFGRRCADADRTSYGCGRDSDLTYFGRAVFGEPLRLTRLLEDAKKSDGFSNPQIAVGINIRDTLARLAEQSTDVGIGTVGGSKAEVHQ